MSGTDEGGHGLLVDTALLEADPLVLLLDRGAHADQPIALTDANRNVGEFVAPVLPFLQPAAKMLEGLYEEALDVMRLEALRLGTLRSEEHTSELQSLMRLSYAFFCSKKKHKT